VVVQVAAQVLAQHPLAGLAAPAPAVMAHLPRSRETKTNKGQIQTLPPLPFITLSPVQTRNPRARRPAR
jgi:hypothetical protein